MLQIVFPLPNASRPFCVEEVAVSECLVVAPIALISIPINMDELSETLGNPVLPTTLIRGSVSPNLFPLTVPKIALPFALIHGPRRILETPHSHRFILKSFLRAQGLKLLLSRKINL